MAEQAHFTGTRQTKPSIFDLVASNSLNATFYPAFKRLASYFTSLDPDNLYGLLRYYDEIFLTINAIVQNYYLKNYGGSLSEVFYGLTRKNLKTNRFSRRDRWISFCTLVILPYLSHKLEPIVNRWKNNLLDGEQQCSESERKRRKRAVMLYFNLKGLYELAKLAQYIAYLSQNSQSGIFTHRLCNLKLDYITNEEKGWTWRDVFNRKVPMTSVLSDTLFRGLELSAFFLQFIHWWQNESKITDLTSLPTPEAPNRMIDHYNYDGVCPICLQKWDIPTVVGVSGYVYCYKCIIREFDRKQECPVSKCPASLDDLVHIYEE